MRKKIVLLLTFALILTIGLPALAAEENLLANGDFSAASEQAALPAGWYYDGWLADASSVHMESDASGAPVLVVENAGENDARICQRVTVRPNTVYTIACRAKAEHIAGDAGAYVSVLDTFANSGQVFDTEGFLTLTLTGRTGPGQTELVVALRVGGYGALASGKAGFQSVTMRVETNPPQNVQSFAPITDNGGGDAGAEGTAAQEPNWLLLVLSVAFFSMLSALIYRKWIKRGEVPELSGLALDNPRRPVSLILVCAFFLRVILSLIFVGLPNDIGCFVSWGDTMARFGPAGFYANAGFADYPPGYMYVLWLLGGINSLFHFSYGHPLQILIIKLPAILADLFSAYVVYRIALRLNIPRKRALLLLAITAFLPAFAFISGGWGQIDSILTLLLLGAIWCFMTDRSILAGAIYGAAILVKPQALMVGPLFAVAYFMELGGSNFKKKLWETVLAVAAAVAVIALLSAPFGNGQPVSWLRDKYFSTATSYPYASVEAFNLFALIGGNWKPIENVPFLFSYAVWGYIGIGVSVIGAAALYIAGRRKNQKGILLLSTGFLLTALFTLGPYMHERYVFPALLLLLIAGLYYNDRRLFIVFFGLSCSLLLNALGAFVVVGRPETRTAVYDALTGIGSLATVALFGYLCYVAYSLVLRGVTAETALWKEPPARTPVSAPAAEPKIMEPLGEKPRFKKKDYLYCWGLTLIYAAVALWNLGTLSAPQTEYASAAPGQAVTLTFDAPVDLAKCWIYGGIAEGQLQFLSDDGGDVIFDQKFDDMFRWHEQALGFTTQKVRLITYSGKLTLREIAFFDADGKLLTPHTADEAAKPLIDEQGTVPAYPSYVNGMYFDELYHARTAYEHLHGVDPYENTHPPLGKVFIMAGIALFGMNTFGWRIVGTLFGIGMVPIFYLFGKRLFKNSEYALLGAVLFAFDFMHFTQTRIATIDVYAVFFIIVMYYFMYQYYSMDFFRDGLKATLKPLGLAGVFFGLGAASKWICIYAGGGLAVLLAMSFWSRYKEYREAKAAGRPGYDGFYGNVVRTLLFCIVFFILIPVGIYLLSYIPYYLCEKHYGLQDVWNFQKYMWHYHSTLVATHPYQSSWYSWPFTLRPMWYYWGGDAMPEGLVSTLTASGNPAVWWACSICTVILAVQRLRGKIKGSPALTVLFVGVLANYLPWVLVTRCTFIYHFFATVPFITLCGVYLLQRWEMKNPSVKWVKWAWMAAAVLLFALLYPGLSGLPVSEGYAKFLQYVPGGNLMYGV